MRDTTLTPKPALWDPPATGNYEADNQLGHKMARELCQHMSETGEHHLLGYTVIAMRDRPQPAVEAGFFIEIARRCCL